MISKFLKINLFFAWLLLGFILLPLSVLHAENQDIDKQYIIDQLMLGNDEVIETILDTDDDDLKWLLSMVYDDRGSPFYNPEKAREIYSELANKGDKTAEYALFYHYEAINLSYEDSIEAYFDYHEEGVLDAAFGAMFECYIMFFYAYGIYDKCHSLTEMFADMKGFFLASNSPEHEVLLNFINSIEILVSKKSFEIMKDQNKIQNFESYLNIARHFANTIGHPYLVYFSCKFYLIGFVRLNFELSPIYCDLMEYLELNENHEFKEEFDTLKSSDKYIAYQQEPKDTWMDRIKEFFGLIDPSDLTEYSYFQNMQDYLIHDSQQLGGAWCKNYSQDISSVDHITCLINSYEDYSFCTLKIFKIHEIIGQYGHENYYKTKRYDRCRHKLMKG